MIFEHGDRIVFAGDSVTDMGSACPVGDQAGENLGRSYVRIIDNLLAACYPERIIGVMNAGISGNTSRDLLARWDRDVLGHAPTWISICIGINDVWRQFDMPAYPECAVTPEDYAANIEHSVTLVDVQKAFDSFFTHRHSASVAWDRIHPNQVGATVIAREFLSHCGLDYNHNF